MSENWNMKRIFVRKGEKVTWGWRKVCNGAIPTLCVSQKDAGVIKGRRDGYSMHNTRER
jgi:hypothetical protein